MPGGKCIFSKLWLDKLDFKDWLLQTDSRYTAKCSACNKVFDISNLGENALKRHMKGSKHLQFIEAKKTVSCQINSFFKSSAPSSSSPSSSAPATLSSTPTPAISAETFPSSKHSLDNFVTGKSVLDAEILWTLKCIKSHYSYKSCEDSSKLFRQMFPDSQIAMQFSCGERKCSYICNFGLAQYFQKSLFKFLDNVNCYTLLFDETLNQTNQQKQMDIHVRFWHAESKEVKTFYLTSIFMGHSTAVDLLEAFHKSTEKLDLSKLLQISMDGPAVNWKFYELLQQDLSRDHNVQCVSVGSCGLHILNNAFKRGLEQTGWDLSSILSSLYWLFKDSPARREDFLKVGTKQKLPLKFCNHRWLENVPVTERAIDIWGDVIKYMSFVENGKLSKVCCKSFGIISEATKDKTMVIKFNVFLSVAKILLPFMEVYQNDKPLMPFFSNDIFKLTKQCLELFSVLKADVVASISTVESLTKFEFLDPKQYETKDRVSLGFTADKTVKEQLFKNEITPGDVFDIKYNCQKFILSMFHNLFLKCPVNYRLVRNACCIDPKIMATDSAKSKNRMKQVLLQLTKKKQVPEKDGDQILSEYFSFIEEVVKKSHSEFKSFNPRTDALDKFFYKYFQDGQYPKLWNLIKMLLILSHGQATVERGFSINKAMEVENLKETSYISQRIVYDHIKFAGSIFDIVITNDMRISVSSARSKYMLYLDEQRKQKETESYKRKRKLLLEEIEFLEKKKICLEKDVIEHEKEIDILSEKAEANRDIQLFMKCNNLRKTVKEKKSDMSEVAAKIEQTKNDLKKESVF